MVQRFSEPAPDMRLSRAEVALAAWNPDLAAAAPLDIAPEISILGSFIGDGLPLARAYRAPQDQNRRQSLL